MCINLQKTKAVIFRPKNKVIPAHQAIVLNSSNVDIVESFKCLGVIFSSHMSWDEHISFLAAKLASIAGMVGRIKHLLPTRTKLLLYNSLFSPILIIVSWYGELQRPLVCRAFIYCRKKLFVMSITHRTDPTLLNYSTMPE